MNPQELSDARTYEIATVLFMDIVRYSLNSIDVQTELLSSLERVVQQSSTFQDARARGQLICLPTGDGMALVFFGDPANAVRTAIEIGGTVRSQT